MFVCVLFAHFSERVMAEMCVVNVSVGTHSLCVFVYTAVFQLSDWIRLRGLTNTTVTVAHKHTQG